ncbi:MULTISPECIES: hypothetical protein [Spirulina sp. CCY15215]|uniref:hypothetical protein n=1 Tax=Spirulina sp. CCY15215 TaxID=2767591 RepID=UPI001951DD27|nr:hypothetical protein [Spirulina major]
MGYNNILPRSAEYGEKLRISQIHRASVFEGSIASDRKTKCLRSHLVNNKLPRKPALLPNYLFVNTFFINIHFFDRECFYRSNRTKKGGSAQTLNLTLSNWQIATTWATISPLLKIADVLPRYKQR